MHFGMIMECDYRYGTTQEESFSEAFNLVDAAESGGMDGVWLAERHFAAPLKPLGRPRRGHTVNSVGPPHHGQRHRRPHRTAENRKSRLTYCL